ncbi:MAG: hypothetical protein IJ800_03090, partial [Clostridia bacterium]|nr:hypothetical protein [Clostridia bacterium]
MKNKKKILLSSVMVIALCLSLIAGSTFALFTSESKVNIAVTSGKVDVKASITDLSVYSAKSDDEITETDVYYAGEATAYGVTSKYRWVDPEIPSTEGNDGSVTYKFTNSGEAIVNGGSLTLNRITPGDRVTFDIAISNTSNVDIQYRIIYEIINDDGLASGLITKIDGIEYASVKSRTTEWINKTAEEPEIANVKFDISLPVDAGDRYQELNAEMLFTVQAVQGNAKVSDDDAVTVYVPFVEQFDDSSVSVIKDDAEVITVDVDKDGTVTNTSTERVYVANYIAFPSDLESLWNKSAIVNGYWNGNTYGDPADLYSGKIPDDEETSYTVYRLVCTTPLEPAEATEPLYGNIEFAPGVTIAADSEGVYRYYKDGVLVGNYDATKQTIYTATLVLGTSQVTIPEGSSETTIAIQITNAFKAADEPWKVTATSGNAITTLSEIKSALSTAKNNNQETQITLGADTSVTQFDNYYSRFENGNRYYGNYIDLTYSSDPPATTEVYNVGLVLDLEDHTITFNNSEKDDSLTYVNSESTQVLFAMEGAAQSDGYSYNGVVYENPHEEINITLTINAEDEGGINAQYTIFSVGTRATLYINGGTYSAEKLIQGSGVAYITGGDFTGVTTLKSGNGTLIITGGKFNIDVSAYIDAALYECVETSAGVWEVKP